MTKEETALRKRKIKMLNLNKLSEKDLSKLKVSKKEIKVIKKMPVGEVFNLEGKLLSSKNHEGVWKQYKYAYGTFHTTRYIETSKGYWEFSRFNDKGKLIFFENSNKWWEMYEYDCQGKVIWVEESDGDLL